MKQCSTCQEDFADKFGFCPNDGTPLGVTAGEDFSAPEAEESAVADAGAGSAAGGVPAPASRASGDREEFHLTFLEDVGLTRRLMHELKSFARYVGLRWPEFKRDPAGEAGREDTTGAIIQFWWRRTLVISLEACHLYLWAFLHKQVAEILGSDHGKTFALGVGFLNDALIVLNVAALLIYTLKDHLRGLWPTGGAPVHAAPTRQRAA